MERALWVRRLWKAEATTCDKGLEIRKDFPEDTGK